MFWQNGNCFVIPCVWSGRCNRRIVFQSSTVFVDLLSSHIIYAHLCVSVQLQINCPTHFRHTHTHTHTPTPRPRIQRAKTVKHISLVDPVLFQTVVGRCIMSFVFVGFGFFTFLVNVLWEFPAKCYCTLRIKSTGHWWLVSKHTEQTHRCPWCALPEVERCI